MFVITCWLLYLPTTTYCRKVTNADVMVQAGFAAFKPHFMLRRCDNNPDSQECQDNCLNMGRYCAVDSIEHADQYRGWHVSGWQ